MRRSRLRRPPRYWRRTIPNSHFTRQRCWRTGGRVEEAADWAMRAVAAVQAGRTRGRDRRRRGVDALRPRRGRRRACCAAPRRKPPPRGCGACCPAPRCCAAGSTGRSMPPNAPAAPSPDNAEFALHHGHLLWRRGDMSEAAAGLRRGGAARSGRARCQAHAVELLSRRRADDRGDRCRRRIAAPLPRRPGCRRGGAAFAQSSARHDRWSVCRAGRANGASAAPAASAARAAGAAAQSAPGRARVDHSRNQNPVRRYTAGLRLGADRADAAYRAVVGDICRADARHGRRSARISSSSIIPG